MATGTVLWVYQAQEGAVFLGGWGMRTQPEN